MCARVHTCARDLVLQSRTRVSESVSSPDTECPYSTLTPDRGQRSGVSSPTEGSGARSYGSGVLWRVKGDTGPTRVPDGNWTGSREGVDHHLDRERPSLPRPSLTHPYRSPVPNHPSPTPSKPKEFYGSTPGHPGCIFRSGTLGPTEREEGPRQRRWTRPLMETGRLPSHPS